MRTWILAFLLFATPALAKDNAAHTDATIPETPSLTTDSGVLKDGVRTFRLEAAEFEQQIANFPLKRARVWGYNGSTPGPTFVAYEGEQVAFVLTNKLSEATTIHLHGLHEPNEFDGVAGISQVKSVQPGETFSYGPFVPGHAGTFAYHAHAKSAVQELRGLDGMIVILPRTEQPKDKVQRDIVMTLQQFDFSEEGALVNPFPGGTGDFPFSTINGKTGEASGGPITVKLGDRIRLRLYNASNLSHSMHLHGTDMKVVSANGHPAAPSDRTTLNLAPGEFFDVEFSFDKQGNWAFHCHVPHHTSNKMKDGYEGAPVGMTRIFTTEGSGRLPRSISAFPVEAPDCLLPAAGAWVSAEKPPFDAVLVDFARAQQRAREVPVARRVGEVLRLDGDGAVLLERAGLAGEDTVPVLGGVHLHAGFGGPHLHGAA